MFGTLLFPLVLVLVAFALFRLLARSNIGMASKTIDARLKRIQIASLWVQLLMGFSFILWVYFNLAFALGWPFFSQSPARMVVTPGHIYTALADMPGNVLAWVGVKTGLAFAAGGVLFALFGLYRRGILFSARNVLYIRFFGYYLILNAVVDYQIQAALRDVNWSTTPIFVGFLIIFIAWIMDEGRKIQEEQALTV